MKTVNNIKIYEIKENIQDCAKDYYIIARMFYN